MKLSNVAKEALVRVHEKGSQAWCVGGRGGGSTARMFDRMRGAGLVTGPPYELTDAGRRAAEKHQKETKP